MRSHEAQLQHVAIGFLAGGQARRMGGGDKADITIAGRSILQRQIQATNQFETRILNANGDLQRFNWTGFPLVSDCITGFLGPLVGVLSCLDYLIAHHPEITHMQSCATDAPFLPYHLTATMIAKREAENAVLVQPATKGRRHPVFTLWPVSIRDALHHAVVSENVRKIDDFTQHFKTSICDFSSDEGDVFMNVNRPEDAQTAERLARALDKLYTSL